MPSSAVTSALLGIRTAVGLSSWLIPRLAGRAFGLDAQANPQSPYLARLFGVRDLALAIGFSTSPPQARRQWLLIGLVCDLADVLAGVFGTKRGYLSKRSGALVTGAAVGAVALGSIALSKASSTAGH
jgi:hypothetical protein